MASNPRRRLAEMQKRKAAADSDPAEYARGVVRAEAAAIEQLCARIDGDFSEAVERILACSGRVVVTGMGKPGFIAQKVSATFASTGTPSPFLHPAEALHGDLGRLVPGDLVLALSNSGETEEILRLYSYLEAEDIRAALGYAAWRAKEEEWPLTPDTEAAHRHEPVPAMVRETPGEGN